MVGQDAVVRALTNALSTGRLHHAYLFTGTRGVGKTTVSRILAKSLNCQGVDGQGGVTATPCGVCPACVEIDAGRFVDYTELDAASNRGVAEVQSLLEQAVYKPVQGRYKVFMIDEVHMLTGHAFNAMLKTLEEPPEYLKFVLATTDPQKVPVTVLSRCLQFNLRPMAPETVAEHLQRVLAAESIDFEASALRLLARAARGSMRDALSLTDQAIAYGGGALREAAVRQMLGSADRSLMWQVLEALADGAGRTVIESIEAMRVQGLQAGAMLDEMVAVLQDVAVRQAVPEAAAARDEADEAQLQRLSQALAADETQLLYSICLHGRQELGLAVDEYAALTMVLLRFLAFKSPSSPEEKKSPLRAKDEISPRLGAGAGAAPAPPLSGREAPGTSPAGSSERVESPAVTPDEGASLPLVDAPDAARSLQPLANGETTEKAGVSIDLSEPVEQSSVPPTGGAATAEPAEAPAVSDADDVFWHGLVMRLIGSERIGALVRELALQSELVRRDGNVWVLRVEAEALAQPQMAQRLEAALAAEGHAVRLCVELGRAENSPAQRLARRAQARLARAEAWVAADPWTQEMMRSFGAKIVPGSLAAL
jgi:DNA polymerase-3 subunit gamma/tau